MHLAFELNNWGMGGGGQRSLLLSLIMVSVKVIKSKSTPELSTSYIYASLALDIC